MRLWYNIQTLTHTNAAGTNTIIFITRAVNLKAYENSYVDIWRQLKCQASIQLIIHTNSLNLVAVVWEIVRARIINVCKYLQSILIVFNASMNVKLYVCGRDDYILSHVRLLWILFGGQI